VRGLFLAASPVLILLVSSDVGWEAQLAGWVLVAGGMLVAAVFLRERALAAITRTLEVVGAALLTVAGIRIARSRLPSSVAAAAFLPTPTPTRDARRDIYFLVWDRYGSGSGLGKLGAGQNDLADWLESRSFYVAHNAHANYGRTVLSLAATLNMTSLDSVAEIQGPTSDNSAPILELIQTHAVGRYVQDQGYRYIHVGSWWEPTRKVRIADENRVMPAGTSFPAGFEPSTPKHHVLHRTTALWQMEEFDRVADLPGPKFVMMHVLIPHEPYVFDEVGDYPSGADRASRTEGENYARQAAWVNDQIKRIVDRLLDVPPEQQPIVVVAGDEGPWPERYIADRDAFDWTTATGDELETKYGILDAFYLPGEALTDAPDTYPTITSWNTFRFVFRRYFDAGWRLLPDRSFISRRWHQPYDLVDITDQLYDQRLEPQMF
jgi:hypothetical protein